jgi:hypothetical protein
LAFIPIARHHNLSYAWNTYGWLIVLCIGVTSIGRGCVVILACKAVMVIQFVYIAAHLRNQVRFRYYLFFCSGISFASLIFDYNLFD